MGYQLSASSLDQIDQSPTDTTSYSIISGESFAYCRTSSVTSAFSEHTDDNSCSEAASPNFWPGMKTPTRAALSRLGMKQHRYPFDEKQRDEDTMELGEFTMLYMHSSKSNIRINHWWFVNPANYPHDFGIVLNHFWKSCGLVPFWFA